MSGILEASEAGFGGSEGPGSAPSVPIISDAMFGRGNQENDGLIGSTNLAWAKAQGGNHGFSLYLTCLLIPGKLGSVDFHHDLL